MLKKIINHLPRKNDYLNKDDIRKFDKESVLNDKPDDFYFQIMHTAETIDVFGEKMPHVKYPYYLVTIVKEGRYNISVGLSAFEMQGYSIVFVGANQIYAWEKLSKDANYFYITFSPSFLLNDYSNKNLLNELPYFSLANKPYINLAKKEGEMLYAHFEKIYKEHNGTGKNKDTLIRLQILELLFSAERIFDESKKEQTVQSVTADLVYKFKALIEVHFKEHLSASEYAEKLLVHPNYLNRITKSQTGKTSSELINERIKLEAIALLTYSSMTVSEISYELGFEELAHFSKVFKKLTGVAPTQYKK